ncbi:MAG: Swt1 family HEPN domain-containing protein [Candidatus Helarchaeota archaeon]
MGVKSKKTILKQIEDILEEWNKLKATFKPLKYLGTLGKDQDEIAKINGLITRTKALISNIFSEDSIYYKQVESHSKGRKGICGRNELGMVMSDLKVVYEDVKNWYEILEEDIMNLTTEVLPDGIDNKKYDEIFDQLKLPSAMFQYIFVCENILRKFIIQVLDDNGHPSIDSIGNAKLTKLIQDRKKQEAKQNYLPIRGDHDIYYLDLIELNRIITHKWKDCFKDKFEDQDWIIARIKSLYSIRNRVAHSSGYLTRDELKSVKTYCREIIKQIDPYIK